MKPFILVKNLVTLFGLLALSQSTFAGLIQYTYSSKPLQWEKTLIAGYEWEEEVINEDDGDISFQFSFTLDDTLISSSALSKIFITNVELLTDSAFDSNWWEPEFTTSTNAKVIINPDGTINAWSFIFKSHINDATRNTLVNKMRDHKIYINSQGGKGTCNCDFFQEKTNFVIERPEDSWIIASYGDATYKSNNALSQWKIEKIPVTEPAGLVLTALGLLGLAATRRIKNNY